MVRPHAIGARIRMISGEQDHYLVEALCLELALQQSHDDLVSASKALGITEQSLLHRMQKHGL